LFFFLGGPEPGYIRNNKRIVITGMMGAQRISYEGFSASTKRMFVLEGGWSIGQKYVKLSYTFARVKITESIAWSIHESHYA
jgi:hypothetical protein